MAYYFPLFEYSFPLFSVLFTGGSALAIVLAFVIWRHRPAPGTKPLSFFLLSAAFWLLCAAFEAGAVDIGLKIVWTKILGISVSSIGLLWLYFTMEYSRSIKFLKPHYFLLLSAIPLVSLILAWTNEYHGLIWSNVYLTISPLGVISTWEKGILYYLNPIYQFLLFFWGMIILQRFSRNKPPVVRLQIAIFLTGIALTIIGSILCMAGISPINNMDFTPFYVLLGCLFYSLAILRFRFMDALPVAHRALVNSMQDGSIVIDSSGFIVTANATAEKLLGISKSEMIYKMLAEVWPELDKSLSDVKGNKDFEITLDNSAGKVYLHVGQVVLKDFSQKATGKLLLLKDITELKNTLSSEQKLRSNLEDEIQKRAKYSRAVVHELRNPLSSVMACIDMLESQVQDGVQISLVQNAQRAIKTMEQRITELYDLARGESGMMEINPVRLDLVVVIREIAEEMRPLFTINSLSLSMDFHADKIPVLGDKSRLRQVMMNLLGNSLKFTQQGGVIIYTKQNDEGFVTVQIEDTGCGMDEEQTGSVFDPYKSKPKKSGKSGLGIGLALSKTFIELHGGTIRADSVEGKGTTISFTLPLTGENS